MLGVSMDSFFCILKSRAFFIIKIKLRYFCSKVVTCAIAWKKAPQEISDQFNGSLRVLQFLFLCGCPDEHLLTSAISQNNVVKCILCKMSCN